MMMMMMEVADVVDREGCGCGGDGSDGGVLVMTRAAPGSVLMAGGGGGSGCGSDHVGEVVVLRMSRISTMRTGG